jgi:type IV pilus biogenesis protein PilP
MQNRKFKTIVAVALAVVSAASFAQKSTTEELQQLADRTAVLEAQLKAVELENKVQQQTNELTARGTAARRSAASIDSDSDYGTPTVAYVEGVKGSLEAVLVYRGNVRQRVREGDAVYGTVVKKISLNEVVLLDVKTRTNVRLQFGTAPVTRDAAIPTGGVPIVLPPGMPR